MLHGAGGTGVSLHLHVSILSSTRFFFMLICPFLMLSPSFSYAPWRRWDGGLPPSPCLHPVVDTFLFYANLSFSDAVPLFFLCSMAQVGRGVSLHLHVSILSSTRFFFHANLSFSYAVPLFFLCSMAQVGRGVSLHLHVSILLSTRFFLC